MERASQEEHNSANFSFLAPSSDEFECREKLDRPKV